jgi:C1A family cysteine protease
VPRSIARYGWVPDLPDQRDFAFEPDVRLLAALPARVDLRSQQGPIRDQGELGSCTSFAIGGALEEAMILAKRWWQIAPSHLFIYYGERKIEDSIEQDAGAMIRDGMKVVAKVGVPPETDWPYDVARFAEKPPPAAYADAATLRVTAYKRVTHTLQSLKACLAAGRSFVFGFTVYDSFESSAVAKSGMVPMPGRGEKVLGGHAVRAVGYDDALQRFIVPNQWGEGWGDHGYCYMPYAYVASRRLASDFWTVEGLA